MNQNPRVIEHATRILEAHPEMKEAVKETNEKVRVVMAVVFEDEIIQGDFEGAVIRMTAMCGEVGRQILTVLGEEPNLIGLMSIGDVDLPLWAREVADQMLDSAHEYHKMFVRQYGFGYDLTSQGAPEARASMMKYFDSHYGFSSTPGLEEKLTANSTIVGGGMRGLDDIASAMIRITDAESTEENPKTQRFVHPDNSFGTWHSISGLRSRDGKTAEIHKLPTAQKDLLHLTPEQVDAFYNDHSEGGEYNDTWCITPVGNPSGTMIEAEQLKDTCERIVGRSPKAKIILDCTYVRTLKSEIAQRLMQDVLSNPVVMDRIVFVESFSKTHGFAGERVGTYFSANEKMYRQIQNLNMMLSAGNGRQKDGLVMALTNPSAEQAAIIERLHNFWAKEIHGLHKYLIERGKFDHLFDLDQSHIKKEMLGEPCGLYLLVKLKPGVNSQDVLADTGCLGVEEKNMGSGTYLRLAVGKIKKPTYAHFIDE